MLCCQHTLGLGIQQGSYRLSQLLLCCHRQADFLSIAGACTAKQKMVSGHICLLYCRKMCSGTICKIITIRANEVPCLECRATKRDCEDCDHKSGRCPGTSLRKVSRSTSSHRAIWHALLQKPMPAGKRNMIGKLVEKLLAYLKHNLQLDRVRLRVHDGQSSRSNTSYNHPFRVMESNGKERCLPQFQAHASAVWMPPFSLSRR